MNRSCLRPGRPFALLVAKGEWAPSISEACTTETRFAHQRLDAYRVALELFCGAEEFAKRLPAGHADLKDQLRRAAAATVRHIAEGANRLQPRDKAARFILARAECGECEATLEMALVAGLAPSSRVRPLRHLADRVAAMLLGLVRRERARLPRGKRKAESGKRAFLM